MKAALNAEKQRYADYELQEKLQATIRVGLRRSLGLGLGLKIKLRDISAQATGADVALGADVTVSSAWTKQLDYHRKPQL